MKKAKPKTQLKKATPKSKPTPLAERKYAIAPDQRLEEYGGQQKVLLDAMAAFGQPITAQELTEKVASKLTTKQDPARVVAYYLNQWQKTGLVKEEK